MIIYRLILLRRRNVSIESCRENQNAHFVFSNFFFFRKSCRLWDNVEKYGRARQATDDNIIRRMRFACCITKATDTHSQYVILIAFPRQQWLRERAWMLRLYVHCLIVLSHPWCWYRVINTAPLSSRPGFHFGPETSLTSFYVFVSVSRHLPG
jgi:hypothetical protein